MVQPDITEDVMTALFVFAAIGAGTYLIRSSMFVALADRSLPAWVDQAMALVGPASIAALVASAAFTAGGRIDALPVGELAALVVGFLVVRRTGNVVHALLAGFPVMWVLALLGL
jgi:branched-subunit amino acid transport protein